MSITYVLQITAGNEIYRNAGNTVMKYCISSRDPGLATVVAATPTETVTGGASQPEAWGEKIKRRVV